MTVLVWSITINSYVTKSCLDQSLTQRILSLFVACSFILFGCASSKQQEDIGAIIEAIDQSANNIMEDGIDAPEMGDDTSTATMHLEQEELADLEIEFEEGLLSCNLQNAGLQDVIERITELTDLELIFSGRIYGRINAKFSDKALHEGLELIFHTTRYTLEEKEGVYVISRRTNLEETDVMFHEVRPRYLTGEELTGQIGAYYGLNPALQYSARTEEGDLEEDAELLYKEPVNFLLYGDAKDFGVYSTIEEEIGLEYFRGPISLKIKDVRVTKALGRNVLFVSGPDKQVDQLLDLIAVLDQKVQQVMIETWLVEYDENALKEGGVDLTEGLLGKVANFSFGSTSTEILDLPAILRGSYTKRKNIPAGLADRLVGVKDGRLVPEKRLVDYGLGDLVEALGVWSSTESPEGLRDSETDWGELPILSQYTIRLQALIDENKLTVVSKPYIVVRSGRLARISSAADQFVIASDPTSEFASGTLEQVETKTSFNIIPTVISDNLIQVQMSLEQSAFTAPAPGAVLGTNKNTASTTLTVANGETFVLGGIRSSIHSTRERGVPILSKIPLIKYLFSASGTSEESKKVNFYITPHLLPLKDRIFEESFQEN